MIQSIMQGASPNATGADRLAAGDALKNATGSTEFRPGDFIQSLVNFNPRDMYISATGGADVRTEAWDQGGNKYVKVFNQRKTTQNPNGEFRRYETIDGKALSSEDLKGKLIVSQVEVPLTQRPFYEAQGVTAKDVASSTAKNWLNIQNTSAAASLAAPELQAIAQQNTELLKKLQPLSVDPQTRSLLAGVGELRTGNTQQLNSDIQKLQELRNGHGDTKDFSDLKKTNAGITMGLNYNDGRVINTATGKTATDEDINKNIQSAQSQMGTSSAVSARKDDLMQRAQALALQGKIQNFDSLQEYINNEYKKAGLIASIEKHGGIGIAKPNLDYQTGDSFSLAFTKNELDKSYADLAAHYANKVTQAQQTLGGNIPAIGQVENTISSDPVVKQRKLAAKNNIAEFEKTIIPTQEVINQQTTPVGLLNQPQAQAPQAPKVPPVQVKQQGPTGSKPPKPVAKTMADYFK